MSNKKPLSSEQKDYIISQLKGELYQYHQQTIDLTSLNNQLNRLETQYSSLQEEMQKIQKIGRIQTEADLAEIKQRRSEIDYLQDQLHQRLPNNNPQLIELAQIKQNELIEMKNETTNFKSQYEQLKFERQEMENTMKQLTESKNFMERQNQQLDSDYSKQIQYNKELENTRQDLEFEITKNEKIIQQQNKIIDQINKEFKQKSKYIQELTELEISHTDQSNELNNQHEQLEQSLNIINSEQQQMVQQIQQTIVEYKQLTQDCVQLEREIKSLETDTDIALNQNDEQNLKKLNLIEDQKFLNIEMSRALDIINQLTSIKQDLCDEIRSFMSEDEQISTLMNRKIRQIQIIQKADQQIEVSQNKNVNNII